MNMKVQIIEKNGHPKYAVVAYPEFLRLLALAEDADDIRAAGKALVEIQSGEDEVIPGEVVDQLFGGTSPLRVWREYRGLTQEALADRAGIGKSYISQIESGKKTGSVKVMTALAKALSLDVDDLLWEAGGG